MLKHLKIRNFAIIDEVEIEFGSGLNIISGETGTGKSILMDALVLILGGRASGNLIRKGAEEASVEALFGIANDQRIRENLETQGFNCDEDELIVRRIVHTSGKNRIYINGAMANMSTLQSITSHLVDLCSQHDQQLLTDPEEQLFWIDRFGGFEKERTKIKALHQSLKEKENILKGITSDSSQREQRVDFLKFQIQELKEASIQDPNEDQNLELELKLLQASENLFAFTEETQMLLQGSDGDSTSNFLSKIGALSSKAKALSSIDPQLAMVLEFFESIKVNSEELSLFIRNYSNRISRDESKIENINARLSLLSKIKKKYGSSLHQAISTLQSLEQELSAIENHESTLNEVLAHVEAAKNELFSASKKLSLMRKKAMSDFSKCISNELCDLHMEKARFEVACTSLEHPNQYGLDSIQFLISANPGEPLHALSKVASGGELSRIILAMHNVVSNRGGVGVFLFDEVDTGIGGKTALSVGEKLQKVSSKNQVICITHLPQVASYAEHHFCVTKKIIKKMQEERTHVSVVSLNKEEREMEIARMLSGAENDKAAIANARAMLEKAQNRRSPKEHIKAQRAQKALKQSLKNSS
jgi:DNA repair protein RecN (Recombination protein N)